MTYLPRNSMTPRAYLELTPDRRKWEAWAWSDGLTWTVGKSDDRDALIVDLRDQGYFVVPIGRQT